MYRVPVLLIRILFTLALLPGLLVLGCHSEDSSLGSPYPDHGESLNHLRTDGEWIRDPLNRAVILRGSNVGSRSKLPPFLPFEDIARLDQLADWGMNSIRLVFTWEGVEPERGQYDEAYLESLRAILDGCAERRIMVILDSHQDLYARNFCGDGFPAWAVHPDHREEACPEPFAMWPVNYVLSPGVIRSFHRFWTSRELKDAYIRMMVHVADRLGTHPSCIGIDLLNEPYDLSYLLFDGSFERDVLAPFYLDLIGAIRERLPETLIVYGTTGLFSLGLPTYLHPLGQPNLVFGAHWYDLLSLFFGTPVELGGMRRRLEDITNMASKWQTPVWIGEYGVPTESTDTIPFLAGQIDLLEEFRLGSAIWAYNPTDVIWNLEDTSLVHPGGAEKPHVDVFVRPYPARIAGTPTEFRFDRETGAFRLTFRADPGAVGPTEIVIPRRTYPAWVDVEAKDGEWTWDALHRRILYFTPQDGALHTLRVLPRG